MVFHLTTVRRVMAVGRPVWLELETCSGECRERALRSKWGPLLTGPRSSGFCSSSEIQQKAFKVFGQGGDSRGFVSGRVSSVAAVEEGTGAKESVGRHPVKVERSAEGSLWQEDAARSHSEEGEGAISSLQDLQLEPIIQRQIQEVKIFLKKV